jgi:hypothetical protein
MSNFIFLFGLGLIGVIVLFPILNWLCDNRGDLDLEKERKLTERQNA